MNTLTVPRRTLTELDHVRIARLVGRSFPTERDRTPQLAPLVELLDEADLVPSRQVSPDVVTMYTQIEVAGPGIAARQRLTLCYPHDAEPAAGFVSVLSPIGAALLGLRVGEEARWRTPDGRNARGEVVAIRFQPEASGDYTI
jgi:regulator of nucleoside diphosphate kinase